MKKDQLRSILTICLAVLVAVNAEALTEKQKEARDEVFKAVKEKKIQSSDISSYISEAYASDAKASAVIEKLSKMKKMISLRSTVGFRGDGNGMFPDATPPTEWEMNAAGRKKNIIWQTPLPSASPSSAIVVGPNVYSCGGNWDLICVDKKSGKIKWVKPFGPFEISTKEERAKNKKIEELGAEKDKILKEYPTMSNDAINGIGITRNKIENELHSELIKADPKKYGLTQQDFAYSNTTPASDGVNIYVWNALGIAACFTPEGEINWIVQNKGPEMHHGYHSSPVVIDGKVIVFMTNYMALDAKDGKKLWEAPAGGGTHLIASTSVPLKIGGEWCLINGSAGIMRASDGKVIVQPAYKGFSASHFASAAYGNGFVAMLGGQSWSNSNILYIYKLPSSASGAANTSYKIFPFCKEAKPSTPSDESFLSSPVIKDGLLYFVFNRGDFFCFDLESGKYIYNVMLDEDDVVLDKQRPYRSGILAPIALANNLIYVTSNQGTTFVIKPGKQYKLLAKNTIMQLVERGYMKNVVEGYISSPFFEGNHIFYRGERYMYCIGEPGKPFLE